MNLEFESLFQQVLEMRDRPEDLVHLGPWLRHQLSTVAFPNLDTLPFYPQSYSRNYIAQEDPMGGFEALIIRWDKAVNTSIHGHPGFSFYHVLSGRFQMEVFRYSDTGQLHREGDYNFVEGDTIWHLGTMGRFDNFIHRVTSLEPGETFHLYSDDARKGIALDQHLNQPCIVTHNS